MSLDPVTVAVGALAAAGLTSTAGAWGASVFRKAFKRDEEQERARLRGEVLGANVTLPEAAVTDAWDIVKDKVARVLGSADREVDSETNRTAEDSEAINEVQLDIASLLETQPTHQARFTVLLVDYYAYGLTQARRSFAVSLSFSFFGGLVLTAGVALAIFHANTNGEAYAAVVTSLAGVLTSSIGVLFHRQAAHALKHMEEQTNNLRQDMKTERDVDTAIELLNQVADKGLQSWLQAALVLQFTDANLPDIGPLIQASRLATSPLNGQPENAFSNEADAGQVAEPSLRDQDQRP